MTTLPASPLRANPVFWMMWLLPGSAVVASFVSLGFALRHGDRPLPDIYHWEGTRLDEDFARARVAATLGIGAVFEAREGQCRVTLSHAPDNPAALMLLLTNGTDASLDRRLRLARVGVDDYRVACPPLEIGKWRISLTDDANTWSLRTEANDGRKAVALSARNPAGDSS